jgi:hypothetical protein
MYPAADRSTTSPVRRLGQRMTARTAGRRDRVPPGDDYVTHIVLDPIRHTGVSRLHDSTRFKREAVLFASLTRRQMLIHRQICGHAENFIGNTASTSIYEQASRPGLWRFPAVDAG